MQQIFTNRHSLVLFLFTFLSLKLFSQDTVRVKTYRAAHVDTITTIDNSSFHSQQSNSLISDSIPFRKRQKILAYSSFGIYAGMLVTLNQAWYANYPRSSFHFFNDNNEWLQTDKIGHAWGTYQLSRASYGAWRWAGASEKKAVLLGSLSGPGFLTVIEILDGFSAEWGFSPGDMAANIFGGGLFAGQQLLWQEQKIDYKFSFHRKDYGSALLNNRADNLFGKSLPERMLKDYNGQSYWLSFNIKSFFKQTNLPQWLNIAIGYGAEGMLGATENKWTDKNGTAIDRTDITRYRQWYLAPDINFTKIKTRSKFLKTVFFALNAFKFPLPGLELSQGKLKLKGMIF